MCVRLCIYWAESLAKLFSLMDQNSPERVAFVSRALKWSTGGSGKLGHPKLHQLLAVTLWKGTLSLCSECMNLRISSQLKKKKSINSCPCALSFPSLKANMLICYQSKHWSPHVFRAKLQRVSLPLPAFVWRRGLRADAGGVFGITRLPQRSGHVCGAGRPTVSAAPLPPSETPVSLSVIVTILS